MGPRADIMQGTLDLMVLRTLETLGPLHGWGIAQRLQQVSADTFRLNQGRSIPLFSASSNGAGSVRTGAPRTTTGAPASTP